MKKMFYAGLFVLLLASCKKDEEAPVLSNNLSNRLNYIIDDNKFNFSFFNAALKRTAYGKLLMQDGPYTVLLPDNNAFMKAGYGTADRVLTESATVLNQMVPYHILSGTWELNKLPFAFNQELTAITGKKLYVTRWVKNSDTILTINGTKILTYNLPATNGLIQVLDQVLQPMVYETLSDALSSDTSLTFLNVALQTANMKSLLSGSKAYTIFAPNNKAFRALGFASTDSIRQTPVSKLTELLTYNILDGRRFIYDYVLTTGATDKAQQAMLNGNNITVTLLKSGVNYTGISVTGIGNTTASGIVKSNVMAGNGVIHITDQALKENQ
ncbi:MAG: fasciclin domain-containing protein [Filimonas sp.]|nr:fasciclin domain-containing protein [Filimonas sp.]